MPIVISSLAQRRLRLGALQHHHGVRFVGGEVERAVQERLVLDDPARLDTTRRREDHSRPGIVDAGRQFLCGKATEDHRVNGPDPGTCQHRDDRFGDHRHVDDDPVTFADPEIAQGPGHAGDFVTEPAIGVRPHGAGHRAVVYERRLITAPAVGVAVEGVLARVQDAVGKPAVERWVGVVEDHRRRHQPVDCTGGLTPEADRIVDRSFIHLCVGHPELHLVSPGRVGRGAAVALRP